MPRNLRLQQAMNLLGRAERCALIANEFGVMGNRRLSIQWARKADLFWLAWAEAVEGLL